MPASTWAENKAMSPISIKFYSTCLGDHTTRKQISLAVKLQSSGETKYLLDRFRICGNQGTVAKCSISGCGLRSHLTAR